jgi:hypothetical protein
MALINYTGSITLRDTKGSALTFQELDTNFDYINSGTTNGTYVPYETVRPLFQNNGDGFGNIIVGLVSPNLLGGITASQIVTLDSNSSPSELNFVTASMNNSGSFLGVALETKGPNDSIQILTEGYYSVYSTGATSNQGYLVSPATVAGVPVFFSGSYITVNRPGTLALTRPLGFCINTETSPDGLKYIKFSPSSFTLS